MVIASGFKIRLATRADVPAMHRIRLAVRENQLSDPARVTEASYLPFVDAGAAWVAETSEGVAGFAAADRAAGSVWALFVDPAGEGAGIGKALHAVLVLWAKKQGFDELRLETAVGSRAERFYRRAGWQTAGCTESGDLCFRLTLARG